MTKNIKKQLEMCQPNVQTALRTGASENEISPAELGLSIRRQVQQVNKQ